MRKIIGIVFVCLMLVLPTAGFATAVNNDTIYVDDDGGADYTNIQDAIDAASDGDTIFVYQGVYHEQIVINKEISVVGEDKSSTIIDCVEMMDEINNSVIVSIISDYVEFSNFTIQYSNETSPLNGLVGINCDKNHFHNPEREDLTCLTVSNNRINNNNSFKVEMRYGINTDWMFDSKIQENIVDGCDIGIRLYVSSNNKIIDNVVQNCGTYGIETHGCMNGYLWQILLQPRAENNLIKDNIVKNNREGIVLGGSSYNNKVVLNSVKDNNIGIITYYCAKNNISKNNLLDNNKSGFVFATRMFHFYSNDWDQNYWGEQLDRAVIKGRKYFLLSGPLFIPFWVYDEHPAQEPYDIGGGMA